MNLPARGYSWEPFAPGNTVGVRHGAFSDRMISAKAAEIHDQLLDACPWIVDTDATAVELWCRVRARHQMLADYVEQVAETEGVGAVRPYLWAELGRAETNLMKATESLGLDPAGRGKLARDLGQASFYTRTSGLQALAGEGARLRKLRSGRG